MNGDIVKNILFVCIYRQKNAGAEWLDSTGTVHKDAQYSFFAKENIQTKSQRWMNEWMVWNLSSIKKQQNKS